MSSSSWERERD